MALVIGVDIGGTFTDAFASDGGSRIFSAKVPSTPTDLLVGFLDVIDALAVTASLTTAELLAEASYITHGTTSSLNALVTGDVPDVGFLTTRGHVDALYIMNLEGRYAGLGADYLMNTPAGKKPAPLVARKFAREIDERMDVSGHVVVGLHEDMVRTAVQELLDLGVVDFAVSYLWSFKNGVHERRTREIILELAPDAKVSLSCEISPRIGEYARNVTTIMNAQVTSRLERYLTPLTGKLRERGFTGPLLIMQGSGGCTSVAGATRNSIATIGSVLTGGVSGCSHLGRELGHKKIISADMGGTTFLAGLVVDGEPVSGTSTILNQFRINTPMVKVRTIGSGGGAIAWLDDGGNLRVGPRSAGASPGPACYGQGGTDPTITDADVVLGIINPDYFLGSRKTLDAGLSRKAIEEQIANPLGISVEDAAAAIYAIANAQAADLVRHAVLEAGEDPRDFVIYAFGGAGPAHVASCATDLGITETVVPLGSTAATFSAYGLAASQVILTAEMSRPAVFPPNVDDVNAIYRSLQDDLDEQLKSQNVTFASVEIRREADLRYPLQMAELETPVASGELDESDLTSVRVAFENLYDRQFGEGAGFKDAGVQIVSYRAFAIGTLPVQPNLPEVPLGVRSARPRSYRNVRIDPREGWVNTPIFRYDDLWRDSVIVGPAIVEAETTTVVVPNGTAGTVDRLGNLVIRPAESTK
jgi:N-methylhydantoinase A